MKTSIRFGADVNDIQKEIVFHSMKVTALHEAVSRGNTELVEELMAAGADVNLVPPGYDSPLKTAIANSCYEVARVLIESGADVKGDKYIRKGLS